MAYSLDCTCVISLNEGEMNNHSLAKEHTWTEHLTSPSKGGGGGGALSRVGDAKIS